MFGEVFGVFSVFIRFWGVRLGLCFKMFYSGVDFLVDFFRTLGISGFGICFVRVFSRNFIESRFCFLGASVFLVVLSDYFLLREVLLCVSSGDSSLVKFYFGDGEGIR